MTVNAYDNLKEVLCNPEGKSCVQGSTVDNHIIDTALARVEKLEDLFKAVHRMLQTPVVDDDFPEMMHNVDSALQGLL